ncbi:hypothetical protein AVEN_103483-1 [Araneus ventricosus]|uniref:Uncharacterized protein n=1 Tax=Araneus ventricosus TaxID=182803 RepID=A0A4Y2J0Y6_ARAVE|nr:hypothetical protein AVEN_103483-1 [Araneus ventricosus]
MPACTHVENTTSIHRAASASSEGGSLVLGADEFLFSSKQGQEPPLFEDMINPLFNCIRCRLLPWLPEWAHCARSEVAAVESSGLSSSYCTDLKEEDHH